ncbi:MAG: TetR/AcrR family transcriptional regulator [Solirubrobacterales bacterium]|nr:TetR/AcrR family transcriptional regulator [Solirubrobacterales bacterium]
MPTPTWERLGDARRRAVVAAAEEEFAARGFSGGSVNVIARNAGVAKGSLFQYFEDKGDLYAYLAELASDRIRMWLEARSLQLAWDDAFYDALGEMLLAWMRYFAEHPVDRAITAAANLEHDPEALARVRRTVNPHYIRFLRPILDRGRATGEIRPDADVDAFLALLILVMPHLALAPHQPGLDPVFGLDSAARANDAAVVARLVDVFRAAFGAAPATPSA